MRVPQEKSPSGNNLALLWSFRRQPASVIALVACILIENSYLFIAIQGTIGKWLMKEGDSCTAGDAICEIETDKASMAFEVQDDFFIAKILATEGQEVKVGDPVFVSVEDAADIAAFANFEAPASAAVAAPTPTPVVTAPVVTAPVAATPVAAVPSPVAASSSAPVAAPTPSATFAVTASVKTMWQSGRAGPLSEKLAASQNEYTEKYGRSLHKPMKMAAKK